MRDGSSRTSSSVTMTGTPSGVSVDDWRTCVRSIVLHDLADLTQGLTWSGALLVALLEELHVTEEFDRLIGRVRLDARRDAPRLLALALFLRHSWDQADLAAVVDRVLFPPPELDLPPIPTTQHGDRGHRRRRQARTSPSGPRARKETP